MRIAEMILREDFYTILQDTIKDYYKQVHGEDVSFSYDYGEGTKLIINSRLGFISKYPAPEGLRTFLLSEYNIRGSKMKNLLGKIVAYGLSSFPQIGKARICFISDGMMNDNSFIYPQNRSVRFFDYESMTVDCIVKSGFTDKYFKNQLEFRKKYSYDFMLPLLAYGKKWFREPIMLGHPLARVTDSNIYIKGIDDALKGIRRLAEESYEEVHADDYIEMLRTDIIGKTQEAVEAKQITTESIIRKMVKNVVTTVDKGFRIPLCISHGDFQSGNIWVDEKGKVWIYDWETVEKRSVWYDAAVLNYSLRREYGWRQMMQEDNIQNILVCDRVKDYSKQQYKYIKSILLLEDIHFYLDDMLELPANWGKEIFDRNIMNISHALMLEE